MIIREYLSKMSDEINFSLLLQYPIYNTERVNVTFPGIYPEENEILIRNKALNPSLEINGHQEFDIWSLDIQKLVDINVPRKYQISSKFGHQFCFEAFCNYFEILASGQFDHEAQNKFDEFCFYLTILINQDNTKFTSDYKRYWREFNLRLKSIFESKENIFPTRFHNNQIPGILLNIDKVLLILSSTY